MHGEKASATAVLESVEGHQIHEKEAEALEPY